MQIPLYLLILAAQLIRARPQLSYVPKGQCTFVGQFICVSATTFALCDSSLTGIIQSLALGDMRCAGSAPGGAPAVPGSDPGTANTPAPAPAAPASVTVSSPSPAPAPSASSAPAPPVAVSPIPPSVAPTPATPSATPTTHPGVIYSTVYSTHVVVATVSGAYTATTYQPPPTPKSTTALPAPPGTYVPGTYVPPPLPPPAAESTLPPKVPTTTKPNLLASMISRLPHASPSPSLDPGLQVIPVSVDGPIKVIPTTTAGSPHGSTHGGENPGD